MGKEFEQLKEALKKPATEEARKEAAERFRELEEAKKGKKGSKPSLVSLGFNKKYPTAIPVDQIADELERNPEFFNHMRDIVTKEE